VLSITNFMSQNCSKFNRSVTLFTA